MTFLSYLSKRLRSLNVYVCRKTRVRSQNFWLRWIGRSIMLLCSRLLSIHLTTLSAVRHRLNLKMRGAGSSETRQKRKKIEHWWSSLVPFTTLKTYARPSRNSGFWNKKWWIKAWWSTIIARLSQVALPSATWRLLRVKPPSANNLSRRHSTDQIHKATIRSYS